eukprot:CAMPEP_0198700890 /NCGR_PEP_ID=MMETSP1468-20131203/376509_1 /TAXON_ID=1461545 /ORGANISM="Mantoniella sp, Strain CCMP1436" /LENGTH=50 /DNA_ID=CAMNT_0044459011 /DNA_START=147 /DNA_END=296 /DNA_ORIENTATION=+
MLIHRQRDRDWGGRGCPYWEAATATSPLSYTVMGSRLHQPVTACLSPLHS